MWANSIFTKFNPLRMYPSRQKFLDFGQRACLWETRLWMKLVGSHQISLNMICDRATP